MKIIIQESIIKNKNSYKNFIISIKTPEELMDWLDANIKYELDEKSYGTKKDPPTKSGKEVYETESGHCGEQSYLEYDIFSNLGFNPQLWYVKENNSNHNYGVDGSSHVFITYNRDNKIIYFEHAMEHAKGIHEFRSERDLINYITKLWWRCDYSKYTDGSDSDQFPPADILEFRKIDKPIIGVPNRELAKKCHEFSIIYQTNIRKNKFEPEE